MRDTRFYSSAYYREQLVKYLEELAVTPQYTPHYDRLQRWINTTLVYINEARQAGL